MKLNFKVGASLMTGVERLAATLGYEISDGGITVTAAQGDRIGVSLKDGAAVIYYRDKAQFFRGLGILTEKAKSADSVHITEDGFFTTLSTMVDASRCAVPTVGSVKKLLDYLAIMGYNMMMLYTEDVLELEGRPYFGYMRGRYSVAELREIDDYAYEYGIEVIPCLECYGHMEKYLNWGEAAKIKDTDKVMLAREEETFKFVEQLIATASSAFRSKRIHLGMDEAWDMGRGKFLDKHGYVPPFEIFNEYMERLIAITDKYGLKPMIWSDMYFRVQNDSNAYYREDIIIPESTKKLIPKNLDLVFWHYGEGPGCDDFMLKKHNDLGRKVIYAGGSWSWIGHFPEHNYTVESCDFSLNACRNNNVREAMLTLWFNDNAECDLFANLYPLSYFAERCYDADATDEKFKARFEACTGGNYDLFYKMSYYHDDFRKNKAYSSFHSRFAGKALFWQDVLSGLYDSRLFSDPMSEHYADCAEAFRGKAELDRWGYLYEYAYRVFDYLAEKCYIAERLVPSYKAKDKNALASLCRERLPALKEKTVAVHKTHKAVWYNTNKSLGWQNMDVRYGGVACRCDTAMELIGDYLDGRADRVEELDEPRLYKSYRGFIHYSGIATVNLKT